MIRTLTITALEKLVAADHELAKAREAVPLAERKRDETLDEAITQLALEGYDPDELGTGIDPDAIALLVGVEREAVLGLTRKVRERAKQKAQTGVPRGLRG